MATLKVNGTLEIGKVILDDWDISSEKTNINFQYKNESVATIKATEVSQPPLDKPPSPGLHILHANYTIK